MSKLSKNIYTDLLGQIFRELFQFKTRTLILGHLVELSEVFVHILISLF